MIKQLLSRLEESPVIAAVRDGGKGVKDAPCEVIFDLGANIMTVSSVIDDAHKCGKLIFIHIDLADGIGRDRAGIAYLKSIGADGIISTKTALLRYAKEFSLLTVKRIFLLDSQGVEGAINEIDRHSTDLIEIMPGIMPKMVQRFSGLGIPVIAGGLIETKVEITSSLSSGAVAVSTGKEELWYV